MTATYHCNVMKLDNGEMPGCRILSFNIASMMELYDQTGNFLSETMMRHLLPDYPYFRIAEPKSGWATDSAC